MSSVYRREQIEEQWGEDIWRSMNCEDLKQAVVHCNIEISYILKFCFSQYQTLSYLNIMDI